MWFSLTLISPILYLAFQLLSDIVHIVVVYSLQKRLLLPSLLRADVLWGVLLSPEIPTKSDESFTLLQVNYMFMRFCPPLLQLIRNNPTMTMPRLKSVHHSQCEIMKWPSSDKNIIRGFLNIFDCHLSIFDETWSKVFKLSWLNMYPNAIASHLKYFPMHLHPSTQLNLNSRVNLSTNCDQCWKASSSTHASGTDYRW